MTLKIVSLKVDVARMVQSGQCITDKETDASNIEKYHAEYKGASWKIGMVKKLNLAFGLLFFSIPGHAHNLCLDTEAIIMSFQVKKSNKILSICKESSSVYLVYRFGVKGKIELVYPSLLDKSSWGKFAFSGRRRDGGKENAGFGDYTLSFSSGGNEYAVFQQWSYEDNTYDIGIDVQTHGKSIALLGNQKTQKGSLVLLESEGKRLPNKNDQ